MYVSMLLIGLKVKVYLCTSAHWISIVLYRVHGPAVLAD